MRVGVLLHGSSQESSVADSYDQLIDHAQVAEENGFDTVWIADGQSSSQGSCSSPVTLASAIAAATRYIQIGATVKLALDHPIKNCEDAAILDLLSGGRLLYGVNPEVSKQECNGTRFAWTDRWEVFCESLDIILKGWTQDGFAYLGRFYRLPVRTRVADNGKVIHPDPNTPPHLRPIERAGQPFDYLSVLPKPIQAPHPTVYVTCENQRAAEFAARNGKSLLLVNDESPAKMAKAYWKALEDAGRQRHEVDLVIGRDVYLEIDGDQARKRAAGAAENALIGSPKELVKQIKALQRETGMRHLLCRIQLPGVSAGCVNDSLRLFAAEVRPSLLM